MKHFVILEETKPVGVADLTILRNQYEEMTDKQLVEQVEKFCKLCGVGATVKVDHKDIVVEPLKKCFIATCTPDINTNNWTKLVISIIKNEVLYEPVDNDRIITIEDFEW